MLKLTAVVLAAAAGTTASADPLNFVDATSEKIATTRNESSAEKAVDVADFDNDGDLDVVVGHALSDFGQRLNELYRNDNGVLQEVDYASIIPGFSQTDTTRTAFFRDLNGDGWLDIHITNDSNSGFGGGNDKVYINTQVNGVFDRFVDESTSRLPNNGLLGASCSGIVADLDGDGDMDLYQGNYPFDRPDRLLLNDGNGFFTDVTNGRVPIDGTYVVDVATGDFNNDGKVDLAITNDAFEGAYITYNDNNGAGSGLADFSYPGSVTNLGTVNGENALEPGDFDNDGDLDLYWSSRNGLADAVYENLGNDGQNKAIFSQMTGILPLSVTDNRGDSRKATVVDLNNDGKLDIIVMKEGGSNPRPTILRNTTVNGDISFVDWSPAPAFGAAQTGWNAQPIDIDNDGVLEIFIGGFQDNRLIEQAPSTFFDANTADGTTLAGVYNGSAALIEAGTVESGRTYTYTVNMGSTGFVAAVVNGDVDATLTINGSTSERGGVGVEEALQVQNVSGNVTVSVTVNGAGGDGCIADVNGDGALNGLDFGAWLGAFNAGDASADQNGDGNVNGIDFGAWLSNFNAGCGSFQLEILARNN